MSFTFTFMLTSPWVVIPNRAVWVEPCGGCVVALSRDLWLDEIDMAVEDTTAALYGPVHHSQVDSFDALSDLSEEEYQKATTPC